MCKECNCSCKGEPGARGIQGPQGPMGPNGTGGTLINISASHLVTAIDYVVNVTANTFSVTLPTAVGIQGRHYIVKNSGTGVTTLATTGGQLIDGLATQTLAQYVSYTLVSNGTNWIII